MEEIKDYHHYKKDLIEKSDKIARLERYISDLLLESDIADESRDNSIVFDLKHHHSTAQFARVLARKRKLPIDVCTAGALLHDVNVMVTGRYKDHAHQGTPVAERILNEIGGFSEEEKSNILKIVYNHSDKQIWSNNPFEEFGKDVDVLDCFLYPNGFGYYLKYKPLDIFNQYVIRAKKIWEELNLPAEKAFNILNEYNDNWFDFSIVIPESELIAILKNSKAPSFCFYASEDKFKVYSNKKNWDSVSNNICNGTCDNTIEDINSMIKLSKDNMILVWTAIEKYEVLNSKSSTNRIKELGIEG